MAQPRDWHREDIKAAIRKTGVSIDGLCALHRIDPSAINKTFRRPWPRVEAIIARHLQVRPQDIWPSRYDEAGNPLRGGWTHANHSAGGSGAQRQKRHAA